MKILVLILLTNIFNSNIFGASEASGASAVSPRSMHFIDDPYSETRLPLASLDKDHQLTVEQDLILKNLVELAQLDSQINHLRYDSQSDLDKETKQEKLVTMLDLKDEKSVFFYHCSKINLLKVMEHILLNYQFYSPEFLLFKDFFDEAFSLPPASIQNYLEFIQFKLDNIKVKVYEMAYLFESPEIQQSLLTGDDGSDQIIFLNKQELPGQDAHITAIVLYPNKYIEIIDSIKQSHPAYPRHLALSILEVISQFNETKEPKDRLILIEHDIERQTTAGDCPYFSMFSALQARYHELWYELSQEAREESQYHFTLPIDAQQLSATCSLNRLAFLKDEFERFDKIHHPSDSRKKLRSEERACFSPITSNTRSFIQTYSNFRDTFSENRKLFLLSLGHSREKSPYNIASKFFQQKPSGLSYNAIIAALKHEFDLFRCKKILSEELSLRE